MFFLFSLVLVSMTTGEEIYENATNICQRCECTEDGQIFTLNCNHQGLHHMLSTWPSESSTIVATFVDNNITALQTLPPTDAVVEVTLSRCNIQYLYPGLFDATKNIKSADLSYNFLTAEALSPENFMGPYHHTQMEPVKLEDLNLAYNQIHSLHKDLFEYLPNLKRLNLEGNDFPILDIQTQLALSSLPGLVSLNLANNELTELVRHAIERHANLTELNLARNRLDFVPASLATVGQSLRILTIDQNPIIELNEESFAGLDELRQLSANNLTQVRRIEANTFAGLTKLQKLSLNDNVRVQTIDGRAFAANQTIHELYLNNNNLTHLDFKLLQWSELDAFEFGDNSLDCSCDLYNITGALSRDITRNKDGPYCKDPRDDRPTRVYDLKSDICTANPKKRRRGFKLSAPLAGLITTMIFGLFVAISLGYHRYRRFLNNRHYPQASQVLYNPLPMSSRI